MTLLHAGIDTASIALWLGHATIQTTQVYLHADLELKRRTLERLPALDERPPTRYQASDALLAFLDTGDAADDYVDRLDPTDPASARTHTPVNIITRATYHRQITT